MITTRLYGRLGNQLFQIATTIGIAKKYNTEALFQEPSGFPKYFFNLPMLGNEKYQ